MKNSFVYNLWSWSMSCLDVGLLPSINFFDWLGSRWGLISFCFFLSLPFGDSCTLPVCFELPLKRHFFLIYILCVFIYQKKKNCLMRAGEKEPLILNHNFLFSKLEIWWMLWFFIFYFLFFVTESVFILFWIHYLLMA